jgi:hypothetical protein
MKRSIFTIKSPELLIRIISFVFLILMAVGYSSAQHTGAPVKKDNLVQVLRSKQFQTRDIVTIINRNGVDFQLTPTVKNSLVAAGARPEVIQAVSSNLRGAAKNNNETAKAGNSASRRKQSAPDYDDLLGQAIYSYKEQRNAKGAVSILETAARTRPENPAAYQMLGYIYLYGLNNFAQAEKSMHDSIMNGGSAVFRVFHDDNGKFTGLCTGSLYISKDTMRFESDDNVHTFETSAVNIDKIKLDKVSTKTWKNRSVFKIHLKIGTAEAKFRFAPLTGKPEESKMVERFIASSSSNKNPAGLAAVASSH